MPQKKLLGKAFRGKSIKFVLIWEVIASMLIKSSLKLILKKYLHKSALYFLQQRLKSIEDLPFVGSRKSRPRNSKYINKLKINR